VQQACTIIQGAAHEDANIIFGAVLDEKMKDSVKITVIATGFKESMRRPRHNESFDPIIVPRHRDHFHVTDHADDFADEPVAAQIEDREPTFEPEPAFEPDPAPAVFDHTPPPSAFNSPQGEVISLDGMRMSAPTYQAEDLDVPAFLRKRNDVM